MVPTFIIAGEAKAIVLLSAERAVEPLLTVIVPPDMLVLEAGFAYTPTLPGAAAVILPSVILNVPTLYIPAELLPVTFILPEFVPVDNTSLTTIPIDPEPVINIWFVPVAVLVIVAPFSEYKAPEPVPVIVIFPLFNPVALSAGVTTLLPLAIIPRSDVPFTFIVPAFIAEGPPSIPDGTVP